MPSVTIPFQGIHADPVLKGAGSGAGQIRFFRATKLVRDDVFDPISGLVISVWSPALPETMGSAAVTA